MIRNGSVCAWKTINHNTWEAKFPLPSWTWMFSEIYQLFIKLCSKTLTYNKMIYILYYWWFNEKIIVLLIGLPNYSCEFFKECWGCWPVRSHTHVPLRSQRAVSISSNRILGLDTGLQAVTCVAQCNCVICMATYILAPADHHNIKLIVSNAVSG